MGISYTAHKIMMQRLVKEFRDTSTYLDVGKCSNHQKSKYRYQEELDCQLTHNMMDDGGRAYVKSFYAFIA